jgi:hypothetical protein
VAGPGQLYDRLIVFGAKQAINRDDDRAAKIKGFRIAPSN